MMHRVPLLTAMILATPLLLAVPLGAQTAAQTSPEPRDATPASPLTGTHWTLTQLNGEPVKAKPGHEGWIELNADTKRLAGSGGCNRLMGPYELDGASLHFRQVASTMMACPGDSMPREQSFLKALGATTSYRIRGITLQLRSSDDTILALLTAQTAKATAIQGP